MFYGGVSGLPDILKVTTPLVNKNQPVTPKVPTELVSPFNLQESSKVIQTHNQSEILKQNTSMWGDGDAPALLLNLLKDPAVAVSYLKNIMLLEEIFKLLPANNKTVTQEIQQLFGGLMMESSEIVPEMQRQESASTIFKGELFDVLRYISKENQGQAQVQYAIANLLKAVNNHFAKKDILDAVANNLAFLKDGVHSSKSLTSLIDGLIARYRSPGAGGEIINLKTDTQALFGQIEDSLLFSPKLSKVLSIITHNLSRYNDNDTFFGESVYRLRQMLSGDVREAFSAAVDRFYSGLRSGDLEAQMQRAVMDQNSKVMESLTSLVSHQSGTEPMSASEAAKIENILHSLLSSPCNFTPLLHFIIPATHGETQAFAEIWINPESDEKDMQNGATEGIHFLMVMDVEGSGRFEAELFAHGQTLDLALFIPPPLLEGFSSLPQKISRVMNSTSYKLGKVSMEPMLNSRSLMEVFKSLPYRRVGIDVKI